MKIETKYSINDTVYLLAESAVWTGVITEIRVTVNNNYTMVRYNVKCSLPKPENFTLLKEDRLFKTKEELVASLLK